CSGPLDKACDPVNGIASEPWRPGCVVAAIGLVHFFPHGRLVEVCGNMVRRLFFRPLHDDPAKPSDRTDEEPFVTEAFFGLARDGETIWAVGLEGLYTVTASGTRRVQPMPAFQRVGGFVVSFAVPHLVLVLTDINSHRSLSGSVPMLVPR